MQDDVETYTETLFDDFAQLKKANAIPKKHKADVKKIKKILKGGKPEKENNSADIKKYKKEIAKSPEYISGYKKLANIYIKQKEYKKADEVCRKAIKRHSKNADSSVFNEIGNIYYKMGKASKEKQYFHKAKECYESAIRFENLKSEVCYDNLGLTHTHLENYNQAETAILQAIEINEKYVCGYINLGHLYTKKGDFQSAMQATKKALSLDKKNRLIYQNLTSIYIQLDSIQPAIELLEQGLKAMPEEKAFFYRYLSQIYSKQGDYEQAINMSNQSLQVNPQDVDSHGNLSFYYLFVKDYEKAEQSAITGLSIDSTKVWIKANLATAMLLQNRYKEAEKIFLELKGKTCFDSDGRTCVEAWLDDFERLEKANAIPEHQKENVEKIRQLLRSEK